MAIDHGVLSTDLTSNPASLPIANLSDAATADVYNVINDSSGTITLTSVDPIDMQQCVVATEYTAMPESLQRMWNSIVGLSEVPITQSFTQQVKQIWPNTTATRACLLTLGNRAASRGEVLFGQNTVISDADIAKAKGRG